ncbi:Sld5 domain-containing protein [Ceratobasidium sp. AG-Ba]|nr:Sld5 domain-containing protein [Ceratobasidium sp. AG-Ba]QRW14704.1 Sld5 domain-containing protein [Ceratobasidium sp. AG-Ba]
MFGDQALSLIIESKRGELTGNLPKYNDETVRNSIRELRNLGNDLSAYTDAFPDTDALPPAGLFCTSTFYHQGMLRTKRCLLAYHAHRIEKLKELYWSFGGVLHPIIGDPALRDRLAPHEIDFLREYNAMVMDYKSDFVDVLDISAGISRPPKDLHVQIRVVRECGTIHTELGTINFQKGQRLLVRRADVEHLIVQGYLEEV